MDTNKLIAGLAFLGTALIVTYFMPALSITSSGVKKVYYVNIAVGVALFVVGFFLLMVGLKSRKVTIKFDEK